jgi:hypothetical protein
LTFARLILEWEQVRVPNSPNEEEEEEEDEKDEKEEEVDLLLCYRNFAEW